MISIRALGRKIENAAYCEQEFEYGEDCDWFCDCEYCYNQDDEKVYDISGSEYSDECGEESSY